MILINEQAFEVVGARDEGSPLVSVNTIIGNVMYRVPQCADLMAEMELRRAAHILADASGALCINLDITLAVVGDVNTLTYTLSPTTVSKVAIVYGVYVNGVRLANSAFTLSDDATQTITISAASFTEAGDTLRVVCSLSPKQSCGSFPAWFIEDYGDTITSGALSRLFGMDGKPWTDYSSARLESIAFHNGVTDSVVRRMHGGRAFTPRMRSPLEWLPSTASQPVAQTQG